MKAIVKKLLLGKTSKGEKPKFNPIQKRIQNIQSIWNNDHQDDNGLEKIVRLFLSFSQLLFPGIYIKYWASKKGIETVQAALGMDTPIWCGDIDDVLNDKSYIVPGLGDAGDLAFGTKMQS